MSGHRYDLSYRIATSLSGLQGGNFFVRHIPPPSLPIYEGHSQRVAIADGGEALRGMSFVEMLWDDIRMDPARIIREMVETVLNAGDPLYLTIDLGWNGSAGLGTWVDVSGVPLVPEIRSEGRTRGLLVRNFRLRLNGITVENNPATGI